MNEHRTNLGKKILIVGSQENYNIFLPRLSKGLLNAFFSYNQIIVSDAAGIDAVVVTKCNEFGIHYSCYGVSKMSKNRKASDHYIQVQDASNYGENAHLYRNRVMVEKCDACVAFWDGHSKETKYTYDYARELNKPSLLILPQNIDYKPAANERIEWV